jgi:IS4 transposase
MLRVRQTNGQEITLLSSLIDLSADQICLLYRYRWTIEIVFRWLRQTLELEHLTSHDPVGILRQILTALIVWGLLVIANQDSGKLSPKQLWRQLQADIHQAVFEYGCCLGFQGAMSLLS